MAIGLGGKEVASQIVSQAYENAQAIALTVKNEARRAKSSTQQLANETYQKLQQQQL